MSLSAYTARTWSDYGQEPTYPEVSAANLNRIETGIAAVTADVLSLEAALPSTYQPLSAELSALAGLSSTGYAKRSGAASWSVVPSIPQADVTGLTAALAGKQASSSVLTSIAALSSGTGLLKLTAGSASLDSTAYLPLAAGSGSPLTGSLYTPALFINVDGAGINFFNSTRIYKSATGSLRLRSDSGNVRPMFEDSAGNAYTLWDAGNLVYGTASGTMCQGNDSRLSDSRTPTAHALDGALHTISGKTAGQVLLATSATTFAFTSVSGHATLSAAGALTLAASGVAAGTYGSATVVPVPTVDAYGRVTGMSTANITQTALGGPFLPLSAGASYPLAGDLYLPATRYVRGGDGTALLYFDGTTLNLGSAGVSKAFSINDGAITALSWIAGGKATFGKDIVAPSITLNSSAAVLLTGSGTNTYTMGVVHSNAYGIVVERPLSSNVSTATPLSFRIAKRGDDNGVFEFEVGATQITANLPLVGTNGVFSGSLTRGGYSVWDTGNLPNAASASCSVGKVPVATGSATFTDSIISQTSNSEIVVKSTNTNYTSFSIADKSDITNKFRIQYASDGSLSVFAVLSNLVQPNIVKFQSNGAFIPNILNITGTLASSTFARYTSSAVRTLDVSKVVHIWFTAQGSNYQTIPNGTYAGQLLMLKNLSGSVVYMDGNISSYLITFATNFSQWIIWNGSNWE